MVRPDVRASKRRINDGRIGTFKPPGRPALYALKSENAERWKAAAQAYRARNGD